MLCWYSPLVSFCVAYTNRRHYQPEEPKSIRIKVSVQEALAVTAVAAVGAFVLFAVVPNFILGDAEPAYSSEF